MTDGYNEYKFVWGGVLDIAELRWWLNNAKARLSFCFWTEQLDFRQSFIFNYTQLFYVYFIARKIMLTSRAAEESILRSSTKCVKIKFVSKSSHCRASVVLWLTISPPRRETPGSVLTSTKKIRDIYGAMREKILCLAAIFAAGWFFA